MINPESIGIDHIPISSDTIEPFSTEQSFMDIPIIYKKSKGKVINAGQFVQKKTQNLTLQSDR